MGENTDFIDNRDTSDLNLSKDEQN